MAEIFLTNLPHDCSDRELRDWVESRGIQVRSTRIILDLETGVAPAFGYVEIQNAELLKTGAASLTGWGEPIMKLVLAKWAADRIATGNSPEWVAPEAIDYLKTRVDGHGGIILLDAGGRFGIAHNTPRMAWALKTTKEESSGIERSR